MLKKIHAKSLFVRSSLPARFGEDSTASTATAVIIQVVENYGVGVLEIVMVPQVLGSIF